MAYYDHADVIVFAEGSACHGVELFGRQALGHSVLLNRRRKPRNQFDEVLRPRSRRYDRFDGNVPIGSVFMNEGGRPLHHRGVAYVDTAVLTRFAEAIGIGPLRQGSRTEYLAAAEIDLHAYLAAARDDHRFNPTLADDVSRAFDVAAQDGDGPIA